MTQATDHLKTLHTSAIDAANGYREALKEAEGKGLSPLFAEMMTLHEGHAAELSGMLKAEGVTPDPDGSFMSLIHRTIMDVRALFSGLDESVLPGLIDGEKRNIAKYDDALKEPGISTQESALERQRAALQSKLAKMESMKAS